MALAEQNRADDPHVRQNVESAASLFGDADGNTADFFSPPSPVILSNSVSHDAPASNLFGSSDDTLLLPQEDPFGGHLLPKQQEEVFDETSAHSFDDGRHVTHTVISPHDSFPESFENDAGASPGQAWNAYEPGSDHNTQTDSYSNDYVPAFHDTKLSASTFEVQDSTFSIPQDPYAPVQSYVPAHTSNGKRPYISCAEGRLTTFIASAIEPTATAPVDFYRPPSTTHGGNRS